MSGMSRSCLSIWMMSSMSIRTSLMNIFEPGWYVVVRLLHAGVESENGGGNLTHELKLRG